MSLLLSFLVFLLFSFLFFYFSQPPLVDLYGYHQTLSSTLVTMKCLPFLDSLSYDHFLELSISLFFFSMAEYNQASMAPPPLTAMIFDLLLPTFSLHLPKSNLIVQALSLLDLAKADTIATTTKSHHHGGRHPLSLSSIYIYIFFFLVGS